MKRKVVYISIILAVILVFAVFYYLSNSNKMNFQVDSVLLKTALKVNSSFDTYIRVTNTDTIQQKFKLELKGTGNLVSLDKKELDLEPEETGRVKVSFSDADNLVPGVYVGLLNIASGEYTEGVPIILEIESTNILFDSNVAVFPNENIVPGTKVSAEIKVFDLAKVGTASVNLGYFVKNLQGQTVFEDSETSVVKSQLLVTKPIVLPNNLAEGDYVLGVVVKYKDSIATSSDLFSVIKKGFLPNIGWEYLVIIFVVLFVILFIILFDYERRKMRDVVAIQEKDIKRISQNLRSKKMQTIDLGNISQGIGDKLNVLERAYSSGYISKSSYLKGRKRLKKLSEKLKKAH